MNIRILLFGVARDIVGDTTIDIEVQENENVGAIMTRLRSSYPAFNDLKSLMVAVNSEYADESQIINNSDEIALIPPVSGG